MQTQIKRVLRTIVCFLLFATAVSAHDVYLPIIIDTDSGADDIRAIAMLLNAGQVDIRLIATSDGVLNPDQAQKAVQRLLACLNQTAISVIKGPALSADPPPFREFNLHLNWPECALKKTGGKPGRVSAPEAIVATLTGSEHNFLYLCLGPMTNLASALKIDPGIKNRIESVIYLGKAPGADAPGWNTQRDSDAAQVVYSSGVKIYGLGLSNDRYPAFDNAFYETLANTDSKIARLLARLHDFPAMRAKIAQAHTKVWDELTVIYLNLISAFDFETVPGFPNAYRLKAYDAQAVREAYFRLLQNPADFHLDARKSVVLKGFPMRAEMMRSDVAPLVDAIIAAHGAEEWKACLLTNEFHRHLGIYSLVGAKMGIRARELLEAPFDTLEVVSHAGLKPPLSCLNDGLQVSTGASLGRGTIRVLETNKQPRAEFFKNDIRLTLTLKPQLVERIKADIRAAIKRYGGLSPEYFAHIRTLSIQYWKDFDRKTLFEEKFSPR